MSSSSDGKTSGPSITASGPSITEAASTSSVNLTDDSSIASSPALGPSIGSESDPMTDSSNPSSAVAGPSTSSLHHQSTLWKCKSCHFEVPQARNNPRFCPRCRFDQSKMATIKRSSLPVCSKCNIKAMTCEDTFCSECGLDFEIATTAVTAPSGLPAPLSTKEVNNEENKNTSQKLSYAAKVSGPACSDQSGMSKSMEQSYGGDNAESSVLTKQKMIDVKKETSEESMNDASVSDKTEFSSPGASARNSVESRTNRNGVNETAKPLGMVRTYNDLCLYLPALS